MMTISGIARKVIPPLVALAALTGVVALQSQRFAHISTPQAKEQLIKEADTTKLTLALTKVIPTFGYRNVAADWAFLQFLQYFGDDEARNLTDYSLSPAYFEVIIGKDPLFTAVNNYMFTSVSLYAAKPETTIALTEQTLRSMSPTAPSNSYLIWRNKAIDELLLLGDTQKAIQSFKTAADWAEQSPHPESATAAEVSRRTADFLTKNPDSRLARAMGWSSVLVRVVDDHSRQIAIQKIEGLGGKVTETNGAVSVYLPVQD